MEREWFEMKAVRSRVLDRSAWIPLRASEFPDRCGEPGSVGHREEYHGVGTVAVPISLRGSVKTLSWSDIGISRNHRPYCDDNGYVAADRLESWRDVEVTGLVLDQFVSGEDGNEWHLHQDLVLGLDLLREVDTWVCPKEGYLKVAELQRKEDGTPGKLLVRTEHLKDFLAARDMALMVSIYRSRRWVGEDASHLNWSEEGEIQKEEDLYWEGRLSAVHEGSFFPCGETVSVLQVGHKDFDEGQDVPVLPHPTEGEFESASWNAEREGRKVYFAQGEFWKTEWVEPGLRSYRIRDESVPSTAQFKVDAAGSEQSGDDLLQDGRWLWFRPEVITAIAHRRGGSLDWYSRNTGSVACIPSGPLHFGVNDLGLVNVYAKDIGYLPAWLQKIWAGFNVGPDGGVSSELLAAQVEAAPASTRAPEATLDAGLAKLREVSLQNLGHSILCQHAALPDVLKKIHRFRAVDAAGLYALAKDIARVTADLIDVTWINTYLDRSPKKRLNSLKATEALVAKFVGDDATARSTMGPLFGVYELRHGDAHLPSGDLDQALDLVAVDASASCIHQGMQLIDSVSSAIEGVIVALENATPDSP